MAESSNSKTLPMLDCEVVVTAEVEVLTSRALTYVEESKNKLLGLLAEVDDPTRQFMLRVLSWKTDTVNDGPQKLWELFNEVIDMSDAVFMDSFHGFVVNCLLDDDAFIVEWRKPLLNGRSLVWDTKTGRHMMVLTDKNDSRAKPVVVRNSDGSQQVALLMEAMDYKDLEVKRREELEARKNELLAKLKRT